MSTSSRASTSPRPALRVTKKTVHVKPQSYRASPKVISDNSSACDQKAVFDWYEEHQYKDDAGEIFSSDWERRLSDWREHFHGNRETVCNQLRSLQSHPEGLKLGLFFRAHPIAAFSLWHVLQASYRLDRRICAKSSRERKRVAAWQKLPPFEYLMSGDIIATWESNLITFGAEVEGSRKENTDPLKKYSILSRMYSMAEEVRDLEDGLRIVESIFELNRENLPCSYWMLAIIREQVNLRCLLIEKYLTDW